jgi:hypothetical protein
MNTIERKNKHQRHEQEKIQGYKIYFNNNHDADCSKIKNQISIIRKKKNSRNSY